MGTGTMMSSVSGTSKGNSSRRSRYPPRTPNTWSRSVPSWNTAWPILTMRGKMRILMMMPWTNFPMGKGTSPMIPRRSELFSEIFQHFVRGPVQIVGLLPTPVLPGRGVIDATGPGIRDFLPEIRSVMDLEPGDASLDALCHLFRRKTHAGQVIGGADTDFFPGALHELHRCTDGIVHIHHGQFGALVQET